MSTIFKFIPEPHATKRTTWVQATNDGQFRTRVETVPATTAIDKSFNYSGLVEGEMIESTNEPLRSVSSEKVGTAASYTVEITNFYDEALVGVDAPTEYFIWYDYKTKSDEAPDSETAQTWPLNVLFTTGGTPTSPTIAFNPTAQTVNTSLYTRLSTTAIRREHLLNKIRNIINNPDWPLWMAFSASKESSNQTYAFGNVIAMQAFVFWLDMVIRAVSIDSNLNHERKFNLLNGDLSLKPEDIINKIGNLISIVRNPPTLLTADRSTWTTYRALGSVSNTAPYPYTGPSDVSIGSGAILRIHWLVREVTDITLVGANVGDSSWDYIRR